MLSLGYTSITFSVIQDQTSEFKNRIIGLGRAEILKQLGYFDITYFDWCLSAHDENDPMMNLERKIHGTLSTINLGITSGPVLCS